MTVSSARRAPVVVSVTAFGRPPMPASAPAWMEVRPRATDYNLAGWKVRWRHVRSGFGVARAGRGRAAVVVCTAGLEAVVAGLALRLCSPRTRLVLFDPLVPAPERGDRLALAAWRLFHRVAVIRRGDAETLRRRAGVDPARVVFVPYPAAVLDEAGRGGGYVYAGGTAHRDWDTVLAALEHAGLPAVLAVDPPTAARLEGRCPEGVELRRRVAPERGRRLAAEAVVAALADTELPAGPLVLLDAMAMGQVVVATDVNGTRDYVVDGVTGLLVPPGDPVALGDALLAVLADPVAARRMGAAARAWVADHDPPEHLVQRLAGLLADLGVDLADGAPTDPPAPAGAVGGDGPQR